MSDYGRRVTQRTVLRPATVLLDVVTGELLPTGPWSSRTGASRPSWPPHDAAGRGCRRRCWTSRAHAAARADRLPRAPRRRARRRVTATPSCSPAARAQEALTGVRNARRHAAGRLHHRARRRHLPRVRRRRAARRDRRRLGRGPADVRRRRLRHLLRRRRRHHRPGAGRRRRWSRASCGSGWPTRSTRCAGGAAGAARRRRPGQGDRHRRGDDRRRRTPARRSSPRTRSGPPSRRPRCYGADVAAHAHGAEGIKRAVRAGVRSIEHGSLMDDEGVELMAEHGTYLVADIYCGDYIAETRPAPRAGRPTSCARTTRPRRRSARASRSA